MGGARRLKGYWLNAPLAIVGCGGLRVSLAQQHPGKIVAVRQPLHGRHERFLHTSVARERSYVSSPICHAQDFISKSPDANEEAGSRRQVAGGTAEEET